MNTKKTPDPLDTWENKLKDEYGLAYAELIGKQWFNGGMIDASDCQYQTRSSYIRNKRLVARGEQDQKKYKDHMARQEGSLDYLNLDFTIVNIPGKFCRVVSNGIKDDYYNLDIRANDRLSVMNKKKKMDMHRRNMRSMPLLKKAKEQLGLDLIPKGFIPEDEEELKIYGEVKERPIIEIAEELTIKYIKDTNDYEDIESTKNKDLVEIGITAARTWTDPVNGIQIEPVDPEYLVHSYVKKNNFKDATYFGYIDPITLDTVKREWGLDETKDNDLKTLRELAKSYVGIYGNSAKTESCAYGDILNFKVNVLRFAFKTSKTEVYKKKVRNNKTTKITKKDSNYNPPERSDYGKVVDTKDTWMEGTFIIGSEYVYNYQECENLIRDERNKAVSPFTVRTTDIYNNKLRSFLDDIEPMDTDLQKISLKMQHLVAELKPDLVIINEDALADIEGTGKKDEILKETLKLLSVKGVVIEKAVDMGEMGTQNKQSARPAASQQGSALIHLVNQWNHKYTLIRDTTGVNPARDGSLPVDALLGVNEMAQLASNTATQHIVDASIAFNKSLCEVISSRVHNIFRSKSEGAQKLRKMYERAVGKQNIDALESMKDRHLHDFGFTVNMVPTKQEMQTFTEDLGLFIQSNGADIEVIAIKNEAQQIAKTNIKLATQYLFYMGKKLHRRRMEDRAKETQMKSQGDIAAAQAAAKSQLQAYGGKTQIDLEKEAKMVELEVLKEQALMQIRQPQEEQKFKQDVFLKQIDSVKDFNMKKYMEDRKDDRTKLQATQQSRMIPERKSENPKAIDFENEDIFANIFGDNK